MMKSGEQLFFNFYQKAYKLFDIRLVMQQEETSILQMTILKIER